MDNTTPHKAAEYDENIRKTVPFYDLFYSETIDLVKSINPEVEVWLDTGCGTGSFAKEAFIHFPGTVFILSDPSENMLLKAKQKLRSMPSSRIQFLDAAGTEEICLNSIKQPQVITAIQAHHYLNIDMRQTATQRCFDLLASNGVYVTFENIHPNSEEGVEIALRRWKRYQLSRGRGEKSVEKHGQRFNKAYFPISVDDHIKLLKKCRFRVAELFWYSHMQAGFYAIK
ncbi:class I SAM-dependent methyltransferase [bacterium]|nr:class I SAM-dependent methyltransferase [bacterium]